MRPAKDLAVDDLPQFAPPPAAGNTLSLASVELLRRITELVAGARPSATAINEDALSTCTPEREARNGVCARPTKELGQLAGSTEKRALLPIAIDELHSGLSRQLEAIERLSSKLEGVLMPALPKDSCNDKAPRPIVPLAVNGVNEATDRLDHHTNILLDLLSRLEA